MRGRKYVVKQEYWRNIGGIRNDWERKETGNYSASQGRSVRSRKAKVANIKEIRDYRRQFGEKTRKKAGNVRQGAVNSENSFGKKVANETF